VRAAVNVRHLAGDLPRLGEIEHRFGDVLGGRNLARGESVRVRSFGLFLCNGVSPTPGAAKFTRISCFAYSIARLLEMSNAGDCANVPIRFGMQPDCFSMACSMAMEPSGAVSAVGGFRVSICLLNGLSVDKDCRAAGGN